MATTPQFWGIYFPTLHKWLTLMDGTVYWAPSKSIARIQMRHGAPYSALVELRPFPPNERKKKGTTT